METTIGVAAFIFCLALSAFCYGCYVMMYSRGVASIVQFLTMLIAQLILIVVLIIWGGVLRELILMCHLP